MSKRERYDRATPYYAEKTQPEIDAKTIEALRAELADMRERCKLNYELGVQRGKMDAEALRAENARLREALAFYADKINYHAVVNSDGDIKEGMDYRDGAGNRARTALGDE